MPASKKAAANTGAKDTQKKAVPATKASTGSEKKAAPKKTNKDRPALKPLKEILKLPIFEKRPRNFAIGNNIPPKRDLTHFVKWPHYVRLQRQKRILLSRLKVPPTIHQFSKTADKATAQQLFKLLDKYRPESKQAKKARLTKIAAAKAKNETVDLKAPLSVVHGFNEVTAAIESKEAKLVVIAHDVDPIELVVWMPTLCRKLNIPYCIVKSKSRLGTLVHRKTTSCVAVVDVNKEDKNELANLASVFNESFNKNTDIRKHWGGGRMPTKHLAAKKKRERAVAREQALKQKEK
jgi:large subunit ribosomal protein L7Ae